MRWPLVVALVNVASVAWLVVRVQRSDAARRRAQRDELESARTICQLMGLVFESTGAIPHHCDCGALWLAARPRLSGGTWHMGEECVVDVETAS